MRLAAAAGLLALLDPRGGTACSYVEVQTPNNTWVIGRTMELSASGGGRRLAAASDAVGRSDWYVVVHPRGPDVAFTNKYGFVGLDATPWGWVTSDGLNEAGLTISEHTMRSAQYQEWEPGKEIVRIDQFCAWALGRFATIDELAAGLDNTSVVSGELASREDFLHWAIADATGASAVLEFVGGKRVLHANAVRVMTNDPEFSWHLNNLNNYVGLTPLPPTNNADIGIETSEVGVVPQVWSHGFNLLGLPGDFSPASRFVRLFYLRQYAVHAEPVASVDDAIVLATGLINNVFIPRGSVAPMKRRASGIHSYELTQFALVKIPAQRRLLFRSYRNMAWREVDLGKVQWNERKSVPVEDGTLGIQDVTGRLGTPAVVEFV